MSNNNNTFWSNIGIFVRESTSAAATTAANGAKVASAVASNLDTAVRVINTAAAFTEFGLVKAVREVVPGATLKDLDDKDKLVELLLAQSENKDNQQENK